MKPVAIAIHTRASGDIIHPASDALDLCLAGVMAAGCPTSILVSAHSVLTAIREARAAATDATTALDILEAEAERATRGEP